MYHVSCRGSIQLLCYCPRKGNDHEHICELLIHYDANNNLELPDSYTAVSTSEARRQHGGPRSKRGAVVGRAKWNWSTVERMSSLQGQWKQYVQVLTLKSPHSGHSLCTTLKQHKPDIYRRTALYSLRCTNRLSSNMPINFTHQTITAGNVTALREHVRRQNCTATLLLAYGANTNYLKHQICHANAP